MTIFSTIGCTYYVNIHNQNYINALVKFGKHVYLDKINDKQDNLFIKTSDGERRKTMHDLPDIISTETPDDKGYLTFSCWTTNSSSMAGVFPKISSEILLKGVPKKLSAANRDIVERNQKIIAFYIKQMTDKHTNRDVVPIQQFDITKINYKHAVHILNYLQQKFDITGCMHFPKVKTILFQIGALNFELRYGKEYGYGESFPIYLHAGIGFGPNNEFYRTPKDHPILITLQKHFKAWKKNNYQGDIIPIDKAGFQASTPKKKSVLSTPTLTISQPVSYQSASQTSSETKSLIGPTDGKPYSRQQFSTIQSFWKHKKTGVADTTINTASIAETTSKKI